jgi:hypothetical protein
MEEDEVEERTARRSGAYSSILNTGGMAFEWLIERRVGGIPWWPAVVSSVVGVVVLVAMLPARRRPTLKIGVAAFLVNAAAVTFALWMTHPYYAVAPRPWRPFEANKLGALTAALLAPNRWAGLLAIAGYSGTAVLQYHLFPGDTSQHLSVTEPWASIVYGAFGVGLLAYRLRGLAMAREVARRQAETALLKRLARASLSLRDLANTPLQTLSLSMEVLRARDGSLAPILDRMERALLRLQALGRALSRYETPIRRETDDEIVSSSSEPGVRHAGRPVSRPGHRPRA